MADTIDNLDCSCGSDMDRRRFLAASAGIAGTVAAGSLLASKQAFAAPSSKSAAEVAVAEVRVREPGLRGVFFRATGKEIEP